MATVLNHPGAPRNAPYKVDISHGRRIGRVSSEWFSRPDDERFLSLGELHAAVRARADRATARTFETREVRVEAARDNAERLALIVPGRDEPVTPTHWSFGQLCRLVGAPSGYLRELPAPLSAVNLQHGLLSHRGELVKTLETEDGRTELRAVTGPGYGRIWDYELVASVMKIAGNGTGDTRWKVPGLRDALNSMPDDQRRVFERARCDGQDYREIAKALGLEVAMVERLMASAILHLAAALAAD